jgi:hypothetical protein
LPVQEDHDVHRSFSTCLLRLYFPLFLLAHPMLHRIFVVCIVPAINRPASGLVDDREPWPSFPFLFPLRACEATAAHFALVLIHVSIVST